MAEAICTLKLRLDLTVDDKRSINGQSKICNWLYNNLLDCANQLKDDFKIKGDKRSAEIVYTKRGLRNLIPTIKIEKPFLRSVHSSPLKNVGLRLSKSIRAFQNGRKQKRSIGWPKYRSFKRQFFSLEYEESNKGYEIGDGYLRISLGVDENGRRQHLKLAMPESSLVKNISTKGLRLTQENREYFAIFTIRKSLPETKPVQKVIALDPNHNNLGYGVDNLGHAVEIESPYWLKNFDKRCDELKSKRDKCERKSRLVEKSKNQEEIVKKIWLASRRYQKYDRVLKRAYAKRREQTKTYLYTVANALCKRYDLISVGDYVPHGGGITKKMRRAMNNRSLIGSFKEILSWCAAKSGKSSMIWSEHGSTRGCHACEKLHPSKLEPSQRSWTCTICRMHHIRDENSAITGLRRSLAKINAPNLLGAVPSSGPVTVTKRWAWRVLPSGVLANIAGEGRLLNEQSPRN